MIIELRVEQPTLDQINRVNDAIKAIFNTETELTIERDIVIKEAVK